jgi:hypothetical protein
MTVVRTRLSHLFALLSFLLVSATGSLAFAQTAVLSGGVYGGGSPLANTTVEALTNGTTAVVATSTTNGSGQYSLTLPLATYDLRVTPPAGSGFGQEIVQDVELTANRQYDVILLVSGVTVNGTVRGLGGQPLSGVTVTMLSAVTLQTIANGVTDANGRYVLNGSAGMVWLQFNRCCGTSAVQPDSWFHRRRNLSVTSNMTFDLDIPAATVSGIVTDTGSAPVPATSVSASSNKSFDSTTQTEWNSNSSATTSSPTGGYAMRLLTGTTSFTLTPPASSNASAITVSNVALTGDLTRDFMLGEAITVSGVVRGAGGQPLSGVTVTSRATTTGVILGTATTDVNGQYSVKAAAGTLTLQFNRSGSASPLQPDSWSYRRQSIPIVQATTFNLDIPVATVTGTTFDSNNTALGGTSIFASSSKAFDSTTQTDWSSNSAVASTIPTGTYALRLLTGTAAFNVTPPAAASASPISQSGVSLTGDLARDFILSPLVTVSGFVRGVGGQGLATVAVTALSTTTGQTLGTTTTNSAGGYSVRAAAGAVTVQFSRSGSVSAIQPTNWFYRRRNIPITGSMNLDVDLAVIRLNGTAADSNGAPVPNVTLQASTNKPFDSTTQTDWNSSGNTLTSSSGDYSLLLLAATGSLTIAPNSSTGFAQATLSNVALTTNITQRIVLQRPDTTAPLIVTKPVVVHLSDTSVSIGWTTNEPSTSIVQFGLGALDHTLSSNALTTTHSITLQNLAPLAIYSYRAGSTDGSGNGPTYSDTAFYTTQAPPGDITAPVITAGPAVAALADRSAVIQWTTDEPATSHVEYATNSQLLGSTVVQDQVGSFVKPHSLTLPGLEPSTTYFVRVRSIDPDGNGPTASSIFSFTTAATPDTQAPVISDLHIVSRTHTAITVAWTTNEAATTAVSYNDGTVFNVSSDTALVTNHEITLAGLTPQRTYNITASSKDAAGNGPTLAGPIQSTTLAAPDTTPPVVGTIAIDATRNTATLAWTTNEPASREVRYGTVDGTPDQFLADLTLTTSHQAGLTGLTASTTYFGVVVATDAAGNASTRTFQFTTLAPEINAPPTAPGPLTVSSSPNSTGTFVVTWGASTDDGPGGVASYDVFRNGAAIASVPPDVTSHSETDLAEGTYTYRIRATDQQGASSQSSDLIVIVDKTAPQLNVPATMQMPATTATDALVIFTVTATDALPVAVTCSPASGSAFPIGETAVNCRADDTAGNRTLGSFIVRVTDPFPPVLTVPAPIRVDATSQSGVMVSFQATATDNADPNPSVVCTPASGTVFAVGDTTVSCQATDASGNITTRTFVITVVAPPKADTTTALAASPATPRYGDQVTLTATVASATGTPSGTVEFVEGTTVLGTAVLSGSPATAAIVTSSLSVGVHTLSARYVGSAAHNLSASSAGTVTVGKAMPSVAVGGGTFTYDRQPHGTTATATGLANAALSPVTITYEESNAAPIDAGSYKVVATFAGNEYYESASATATIVINRAMATVSATNVSAVYDRQPHPSTVLASGVDGEPLGPLTVSYNGGPAEPVNAGSYPVLASFVGNTNYFPASATATVSIGQATPSLSVTGGTFTYNAVAHPASVTFTGVNGEVPGSLTVLYNGSAAEPIAAGSYAVDATFAGSVNYQSISGTATVTIAQALTATGLSASAAASVWGETVRLTALVHAIAPGAGLRTGTVDFFDGAVRLGAAAVQPDGTAALALSSLAVGSHSLTALYNGDGNFLGSSAGAVTHTVARAPVSVVISSSPNPSGFGEPVVITAEVAAVAPGAGAPAGTVELFNDGVSLGTAAVTFANGRYVASLTTTSMAVGTHALTGSYSGDNDFNPGVSAAAAHTVNPKASSTTTEMTAPATAAINTTVPLEAAVSTLSGNGDPTGSVEFSDGTVVLGTSTLALSRGAMRATLAVSFATVGGRQITARYVPNGLLAASTSAPASVTVYDPAVATPQTTRTSINAPRNANYGDTVLAKITVRATGNGPNPTGNVDVHVDGVLHTRAALVNGEVSASIAGLAKGMHSIIATYLGDATYAGSTSSADVNVVK